MSKYAPFANLLRTLPSAEVRFTFAEIEQIIGAELPRSARSYPAWWSNSRTHDSHTWAHEWLKAGWEKSGVNFRAEWVTFRRVRFYDIDSKEAREGYEFDRAILIRGRNAALARSRKELDNYTCQACGFRLEVDGRFIIEVHHCDPLAATGETDTTVDDLVSLCPTCHRIAHLRSTPYRVDEIRAIRSGGQG
jgi:hypothetical protein